MKTKKVIIKEENRNKIEEMLAEVQEKSRVRTISFDDMMDVITRIEKRLGEIRKKYWKGIRVHVDCNAQDFPGAYKGTPESTQFTIERATSGWALTGISRNRTKGQYEEVYIELTEEAKQQLLDAYRGFKRSYFYK